ncbi:MAG: ABC transporter permease [Armatimonadota bacterium]|nr:ABC transporter permease [Armatimonadota bacterium]
MIRFGRHVWAVVAAEVSKLRHDPVELATRAVQPTLWLVVFGSVMAHVRELSTGNLRYLDFITPGVLAQSTLFISIFFGIAAIWERDLGVLQKLLVSPASREALVLGKALSAGARGLSQAAVVYLLALVLGIALDFRPLSLLGVLAVIVIGCALFSSLSLVIACLVKTRERFMGIGQVLTMPLFFASSAIYPLDLMPGWLRAVSVVNPLTYEVDALRSLMIAGGGGALGVGADFAVLIATAAVLIGAAARLYPAMAA